MALAVPAVSCAVLLASGWSWDLLPVLVLSCGLLWPFVRCCGAGDLVRGPGMLCRWLCRGLWRVSGCWAVVRDLLDLRRVSCGLWCALVRRCGAGCVSLVWLAAAPVAGPAGLAGLAVAGGAGVSAYKRV